MKTFAVAAGLTAVAAESLEANPIRKIVTLLQKMQEKTIEEGRQEDELYKKFDCFCKKNKEEIGANGEELQRKMDAMEAGIQEHSAAADSFKQAVADAKREREENQAALAQAQSVRAKESEEYQAQTEAGNMDVAAMKKAVGILSGTSATKEELLQAVGDARVKKIVLTAQGVSDFERDTISSFLANPYGNHVNDPVRGEVVGMLNQMIETMEGDLSAANEAEAASAKAFEEMRAAKNAEIDSLSKQIETGTQRQGEEAVAAANLKTQLTDAQNSYGADLEFIQRLTENCATKEKEYGERKAVRAEEVTAITEVIDMLNNDDSLMKFHTAKQHTAFIQKGDTTAKAVARAYAMIRGMSSTPRFSFLAYNIKHSAGKFENVIKIINDMIALLDEETTNDETHRDHCTSEFHRNEKEHMAKENDIDGLSQKISSLEENIAAMQTEVEEKEKIIAELDESVAAASEQRKSEHEEYNVLVKDTDAAVVLLGKAKNRLNKFYNPNLYKEAPKEELSEEDKIIAASTPNFLQKALVRRSSQAAPREPAPETWSGDYKTKAQGSSGVVALMDTLLNELTETKTLATAEETNSQKEYEGFMEECKKNKASTVEAKTHIKAELEDSAESLNNDQGSLASATEELGDIVQETADLHAECDFLLQNFDFRAQARATERESLVSALSALNGADITQEPEAEPAAESFLQQEPTTGEAEATVEANFNKIAPFGAQDTAQELTNNSGDAQNTLVDAVENAEVAEIKRAVFRALTRLRAATIKEFDTIARLETQAIDAYNDAHHYTAENPITPLGGGDASQDALSSFH